MMVRMSRADRRHHRLRCSKRNARNHPDWPRAAHFGDTRKTCSCWMCGNQRRYAKGVARVTIQERRHAQRDVDC